MMQQRSLMPSDVINAIQRRTPRSRPARSACRRRSRAKISSSRSTSKAISRPSRSSSRIIVNSSRPTAARSPAFSDIGRVELGAQTYSQFFKMNGNAAGGIAIFQLPEANALDTAKARAGSDGRTREGFSRRSELHNSVRHDGLRQRVGQRGLHTLFEAGLLVLIVIVVFLQDWRATLVPATTVPVTIIGAFAAMAAMGFTINLLTLFAIVLAIGIVVDDAIVVVEGATQHIERGKTPKQASIDAMSELIGPIIGITLVLMSVFLPPAFMPGITGQMYRQFALVIAATALISAINAATLKPTQCAMWLRATGSAIEGRIFSSAASIGLRAAGKALHAARPRMVGRSGLMVVVGLVLIALAGWGFTRVPTGFIPTEDQGYVIVAVQLPDGASLERTERVMDELAEICRGYPAIERTIAIGGVSPLENNASLANAGVIYVMLKDWSERGKGEDLRSIYNGAVGSAGKVPARDRAGARAAADSGPGFVGRIPDAGRADRRQLTTSRACRRSRTKSSASQARSRDPDGADAVARSAPQMSINVDRTRARNTGRRRSATFSTRCRAISDRASSICSRVSVTPTWSTRRPTRSTGSLRQI